MPKSPLAERLDLVQTQVTGFLRPIAFTVHGRSYNRLTRDSLTAVVTLQLVRGRVTVNLGVWVPEVARYQPGGTPTGFVPEHSCHVRARIGDLADPPEERWWDLEGEWPDVAADVVRTLDERGLPFLEHFATRDAIVADWLPVVRGTLDEPAARIAIAIILAVRGDRTGARRILRDQYALSAHSAERRYLEDLAARLGVAVGS